MRATLTLLGPLCLAAFLGCSTTGRPLTDHPAYGVPSPSLLPVAYTPSGEFRESLTFEDSYRFVWAGVPIVMRDLTWQHDGKSHRIGHLYCGAHFNELPDSSCLERKTDSTDWEPGEAPAGGLPVVDGSTEDAVKKAVQDRLAGSLSVHDAAHAPPTRRLIPSRRQSRCS